MCRNLSVDRGSRSSAGTFRCDRLCGSVQPVTDGAANFGWRRAWLLKACSGSLIVASIAAMMAIAIAWQGFGDFGLDRRIIFAAAFVAFAVLLLATAATYVLEALRPRWVVSVGDAGLHDRRVSCLPIRWEVIRAVVPVQHGMQLLLALDVETPRTVPLSTNPVWRLNRLASRLLGNPELTVRVTGLDADLFAVMHAIEARRAASSAPTDAAQLPTAAV